MGIARFVRRFADFGLNDIIWQICLLNRKIMSTFDFGLSDRRLHTINFRRMNSPENESESDRRSYRDLYAEQGLVSLQTDLISFTKTTTKNSKKVIVKIDEKAKNTFRDFSIRIYPFFSTLFAD